MNGRQIFAKYYRQIDILVRLLAVLPKSYRKHRLEAIKYKSGNIAMMRRYLLVKSLSKKCGKNVAIFPCVFFENIENLEIGDNVSIHQMCYIDAEGGIEIGNDVSIAHRSTVLSSNHNYNDTDIPIKYQGMTLARTVIKDNVWIGCGCAIMAGVEIGEGTVVGANSTVTKSVIKDSVVIGSPAMRIKNRTAL